MQQDNPKKRGLGMGLSALLGNDAPDPSLRPLAQSVPIRPA